MCLRSGILTSFFFHSHFIETRPSASPLPRVLPRPYCTLGRPGLGPAEHPPAWTPRVCLKLCSPPLTAACVSRPACLAALRTHCSHTHRPSPPHFLPSAGFSLFLTVALSLVRTSGCASALAFPFPLHKPRVPSVGSLSPCPAAHLC